MITMLTSTEQYFLNKSKTMPILALIQGEVQSGKSTLFNLLANDLSLLKNSEEWDYKKYCARTIHELLRMYKKYDNAILGYEEAGKDLDVSKWYDSTNSLFNMILQTQGYKKNILVMVLPCGLTIAGKHRRLINIGIEIIEKNESKKLVVFRACIYKRRFFLLKDDDVFYGWLPKTWHIYSDAELTKAKEYTDWLKLYKEIILNQLIEKSKDIEEIDYDNPNIVKFKKPRCYICDSKKDLKIDSGIWYCPKCFDYWVMGK